MCAVYMTLRGVSAGSIRDTWKLEQKVIVKKDGVFDVY